MSGDQQQLVELSIRRYKHLVDVRLPLSDGVALFGVNGAGKTNVLEALAVVLGSKSTLELARPRLGPVAAGSLSVKVRTTPLELPWPPDALSGISLDEMSSRTAQEFPVIFRAYLDRQWWDSLGLHAGETFVDAMESAALPPAVVDYLQTITARPSIEYTLDLFQLAPIDDDFVDLDDDDFGEPGVIEYQLRRRYSRTLLGPAPPNSVRAVVNQLPDSFAPLRTALTSAEVSSAPRPDQEGDHLIPVLALSDSLEVPVVLDWVARGRRSAEAQSELHAAFAAAHPAITQLSERIDEIFPGVAGVDADSRWWLHELIRPTIADELAHTLTHLTVRSNGERDADWDLVDERLPGGGAVISRSSSGDVLEPFSAGERRWVDEALAVAARAMRDLGRQAGWQAVLIDQLDDDELLAALEPVADEVEDQLKADGFWNAPALSTVLGALRPALLRAASENIAARPTVVHQAFFEALLGLGYSQPKAVVRVIDEPEAHLHPGGQRAVAAGLDELRTRTGTTVVIASHSPHFLALPGWDLIHLQRTPEGATVSRLVGGDLDARKALAGQMGLTRGELLTRVGFVLVVEGVADQLVLEAFYGAELDEAGVAVLCMHGTDYLLTTAEMDFVDRYLDVDVGVMLDYVRPSVLEADRPPKAPHAHDEEIKLWHLRKSMRRKRRHMRAFGLTQPDIVVYLHEDAIRAVCGASAPWARVRRDFEQLRRRPAFKDWLHRTFGVDLTSVSTIDRVVRHMKEHQLRPAPELERVAREVIAAATSREWLPTGLQPPSVESR